MSQAEIRKRRKEIDGEIARIAGELEVARAKLKALQGECNHPKMRSYSAMGELGNYCPDCDYQD